MRSKRGLNRQVGWSAVWIGAAMLWAVGCAPRQQTGIGPVIGPRTGWPPGSAATDTLVVAGHESLRLEHAPVPANDVERLVFAQIFQTLFRLHENGVVPDLAARAHKLDGGRRWRIELRGDLHYSDGSEVRAVDFINAWQLTRDQSGPRRRHLPWALVEPDRIRVAGLDALELRFGVPVDDLPRLLCHPALALAIPRPGRSHQRIGTGPYALTGDAAAAVLVPNPHSRHPGSRPIRLALQPGRDARDFAASGAHLWITREPGVIAYFRSDPAWQTVELPADGAYWLIARGELAAVATKEPFRRACGFATESTEETRSFRDRECVTGGRSISVGRAWPVEEILRLGDVLPRTFEGWQDAGLPALRQLRVVCPQDDPIASGLADAVAAAGSDATGHEILSAPRQALDWIPSARRGFEAGFVVRVDAVWNGCWEDGFLAVAFPWLLVDRDEDRHCAVRIEERRAHVVARSDLRVVADPLGRVRF